MRLLFLAVSQAESAAAPAPRPADELNTLTIQPVIADYHQ